MTWTLPHRLTPPYMFVLGIVQLSMQHFHAHAVAELPARDYETCPKYWWRNLLYINTFFPNSQRVGDMCDMDSLPGRQEMMKTLSPFSLSIGHLTHRVLMQAS